jgi:hypothetical protein
MSQLVSLLVGIMFMGIFNSCKIMCCITGPTSFAPIIQAAIDIVAASGCQYHVLLIIADGQASFEHMDDYITLS